MPALHIDLNADLGEGAGTDLELLEIVSSASIACGGHAGGESSMRTVTSAAAARKVAVGAHPSYPDREGFGRRSVSIPPDALARSIAEQIDSLRAVSAVPLSYVKAHGALYNDAAADPELASLLVSVVSAADLALLCPGGSALWGLARGRGVTCFAEAFADRAYTPAGTLAGRDTAGALIVDPEAVARRAVHLALDGRVEATDGTTIAIEADSICIHGDTPGAVPLAAAVRAALTSAGVVVRAFAGTR